MPRPCSWLGPMPWRPASRGPAGVEFAQFTRLLARHDHLRDNCRHHLVMLRKQITAPDTDGFDKLVKVRMPRHEVGDPFQALAHNAMQPVSGRARPSTGLGNDALGFREPSRRPLGGDVFLVREIPVEIGCGHAAVSGDFGHGCLAEAIALKSEPSGFEYLLAHIGRRRLDIHRRRHGSTLFPEL